MDGGKSGILTQRLSEWFEPAVRAKGDRYATDRRVLELEIAEDNIASVVHGTEAYDIFVDIEQRPGRWIVRPDCTCPYGYETGGFCKHVWATLVTAEQRDLSRLGPLPKTITVDEDDEPLDPIPISRPVKPEKKRPQVVPAWIKFLDGVPRQYAAPNIRDTGPIGEVLYVVDIERTQSHGALLLALMQSVAGDPAKAKPPKLRKLGIHARDIVRLTNPIDRTICGMLVGAGRPGRDCVYGSDFERGSGALSSLWYVNPRLFGVLGPLLRDSRRLFSQAKEGAPPSPLTWDDGPPWTQVLAINPSGDGRFELSQELRRGPAFRTERMPLAEAELLLEGDPGLVMRAGVLSTARVHGSVRYGAFHHNEESARITPAELPGLLSALTDRHVRLPVVWPETWPVKEVNDLMPRGRITLWAKPSRDRAYLDRDSTAVEIAFEYSGEVVTEKHRNTFVAPSASTSVEPPDAGIKLIRRQLDAEKALMDRARALKVKPVPYYSNAALMIESKRVPTLVSALLTEGWTVLGDTVQYKRPGEFKIEVSSGIDWFNLNGHCDFQGQHAGIADILRALKSGERFVMLGDGSLGMLPEQWLARHGKWLQLGEVDGKDQNGVRFSKAQVGIIDALLADMPEATCDAQVAAARKRLAGFTGIAARREPKKFRGTLREYQREGLGWLTFLTEFGFGGILADDMGLGKTVQLLAHILDRRQAAHKQEAGPWLIVAPKSLVFNWEREAERFAPGLKVLNYTGLDRKGRAQNLADADLVITTYATMRLDIEEFRKTDFACVVLDEAQAIKNADSQVAKASRLLRARRRLALTGTPVENRIADLWSLLEFLNPGMLGGAAAFQEALGGKAADADLGILRRAVRPFILRRTKDKVAPELPARSEQTIVCDLGKQQRSLYDGLLKHYRDALLGHGGQLERHGINKSKIQVLEALLRLRQAACHPALIELKPKNTAGTKSTTGRTKPSVKTAPPGKAADSAKVETLIAMLEELTAEGQSDGGHKALVFSQFTSLLALVREQLDARGMTYAYLDGGTAAKDRARAVDRFQSDPSQRIFLISLKAGGVGLNLTAADYVFLLDPWWNPAVEAQAIDRTHRIGQDKKVIAYRLIARDTVEERIQQLQASKRELAEAIVSQQDGPLSGMTKDDLSWLLS